MTYVKFGGPPEDWKNISVIHLPSGQQMRYVLEANAEEGWVRRHKQDAAGNLVHMPNQDAIEVEVVHCKLKLVRRAPDA